MGGCVSYTSNGLYDQLVHTPIGQRNRRGTTQTLLGGIEFIYIETLANKFSILQELKAVVTRRTASWLPTALQTSIQDWQGTWHL